MSIGRGRPKNTVFKQQLNLRMDQNLIDRVKIHAVHQRLTASQIIEELIAEYVPEYTVTEKEKSA